MPLLLAELEEVRAAHFADDIDIPVAPVEFTAEVAANVAAWTGEPPMPPLQPTQQQVSESVKALLVTIRTVTLRLDSNCFSN